MLSFGARLHDLDENPCSGWRRSLAWRKAEVLLQSVRSTTDRGAVRRDETATSPLIEGL